MIQLFLSYSRLVGSARREPMKKVFTSWMVLQSPTVKGDADDSTDFRGYELQLAGVELLNCMAQCLQSLLLDYCTLFAS